MASLEVLHVLGSAQLQGTAIAQQVLELAKSVDPDRYRISALFLDDDGPLVEEFRSEGLDVATAPWRGWRDLPGAGGVLQALRARRFDIVHRHTGGRAVQQLIRAGSRAKIVAHAWSVADEAGEVMGRAGVAGADQVIVISFALRTLAPPEILRVVHPGLDLRSYRPKTRPEESEGAIIGAASRFAPIKGLPCLLRAFALVAGQRNDVTLELAGDGPDRHTLIAEAQRLGIADRVRFLGWRSDLPTLLPNWTVFAQPSVQEGFGLSALQAMGAGLPVVATAVGGVSDLIVDGVTGHLVPSGDWRTMARALLTLLESPEISQRMGVAGRERALRYFTAERMAIDTVACYDELLGRSGTDRRHRPGGPDQVLTGAPDPIGRLDRAPQGCSLVIATRFRQELLGRCLEAVAALDRLPQETIVVDNSEGDAATRRVAEEHGARYVVAPRTGHSGARNAGARAAGCDIVVFADDDILPQDGWLPALCGPFMDPTVMAVTGRVVLVDPATRAPGPPVGLYDLGPLGRTVDISCEDWFETTFFGRLGVGPNMAFRRSAFDVWPGFRETLGLGTPIPGGEEHYALFDLVRRGFRVVYVPDAMVGHPVMSPSALGSRYRQAFGQAAASVTLALVEEPDHRRQVLRLALGSLKRSRGGGVASTSWRDVLPLRDAAVAAIRGPVLYARSRARP